MADETIWYFIKFFQREEHANQFIDGTLHLNRLSYFKRLENDVDDSRLDSCEAVAKWWQPHDVVIDLSVPGVGATRITRDDLAAPVSIQFDFHDHLHLFCLYAVYSKGFACIGGKFDLSQHQVAELEQQIEIDDRCLGFGPHAVIVRAVPFLDRVKFALRLKRLPFRGKLVTYYDDETFHGEIPAREIPFMKQKRFSYQKEFRICVQTNTKGNDPLRIDIGNISTMSAKVEARSLKNLLKLQLEAA